jgi:hypothetical protein
MAFVMQSVENRVGMVSFPSKCCRQPLDLGVLRMCLKPEEFARYIQRLEGARKA